MRPEEFTDKIKTCLKWVPVAIYCALIFYVSILPLASSSAFSFDDKVRHMLIYIPLGFMLYWILNRKGTASGVSTIIWIGLITAFYGTLIEIRQAFLPFRSAEVLDCVADVIGGVIGAILFILINLYVNVVRLKVKA